MLFADDGWSPKAFVSKKILLHFPRTDSKEENADTWVVVVSRTTRKHDSIVSEK